MSDILINIQLSTDRSYQQQIREKLIDLILSKQFGNKALPSIRKMATLLGVSRNTITLVYESLIDDGYLLSKARSGFFVNPGALAANVALTKKAAVNKAESSNAPNWDNRIKSYPDDLIKLRKDPAWMQYEYPFIYGQIETESFPIGQWRDCSRWVQSKSGIKNWVEDHIDEDDTQLVQQIIQQILATRGIIAEQDEVLITLGTQNSMFMLASLIVNHKTSVGVENPGYIDFRNILQQAGAHLIPLNINDHGLVISNKLTACDYVSVTPSHQYPTTVTMPLERREVLLTRATKDDFVIIEDDYESEVNFISKPLPALKSMDDCGRVIYLGSLSKSLSPGLRIGYMVADKVLIQQLRAIRRLNYRHPPANNQRITALLMSQGYYSSHIRRMKQLYEEKWYNMSINLKRYLPMCTITETPGSFCFWLKLPRGVRSADVAEAAKNQGILVEPGDNFFMTGSRPHSFMRMGFSAIPLDKIKPGLKILGKLI